MSERGRFSSHRRAGASRTCAPTRLLAGCAVCVVCAVVVAAAAGCSGDPGADPVTLTPHPTSTVPTTSVAPSTTDPPTLTGAATPTTSITLYDEHDESIDAFVRDFFAAYNAAQDSRDLSAFEAMYLPQCTGCIEMRDELAGWLADGHTIEGGDWHILQQNSSALADKSSGFFSVVAYRDAARVLDGDTAVQELTQTVVNLVLGGVRSGDGWLIEDMGFEDA